MQMNARQAGDRGLVEAAASRAAVQVYHTGQGQDEHAAAHSTCRQYHLPLHGLDSAWSWSGNPHRESGTRSRAAADVGLAGMHKPSLHRRQNGRRGDRLGDSVGRLGGSLPMGALSRLKDRRLIAFTLEPHSIDNPHPDVGQCSYRHTVTLALCALALIVGHRPGFLRSALPRKLLQHIAQRFDAGRAFVGFGIVATFVRHRRGSCQRLNARRISVAVTIIAPFCAPAAEPVACLRPEDS